MSRVLLLCLLLWAQGVAAAGDSYTLRVYDERLQRGIDLIYGLRFAEADQYFGQIIAAEPENPVGHFFLAMVTWWRVLVDLEDRSHDQAFYGLLEKCIQVCDRRLEQSPNDFDAVLCKGGATGFRGRLRGDRHQFLQAASDGLKCLPLLDLIRQLEPTNKDVLFGRGIYNYFVEVMPERYPIVKPIVWLMEKGDRQLGLQQLQQVAEEGYYARAEAAYFLAQIYRVFERDKDRALEYLEQLHARYPDNSLFHRYTARTLIDLGQWDRGTALYREVARRSAEGRPGYHLRGQLEALFFLGKDAFRRNRLDEAIEAFAAVDSLGGRLGEELDRHYVALANLLMGMCFDLQGQRAEAVRCYERVQKRPDYNTHDLAAKYLKTPYGTVP